MPPAAVLTGNLFMPWWQNSQSQIRKIRSCPICNHSQPGELFRNLVRGHAAAWVPAALHVQHKELRGSINIIFHTHMVEQNQGVCLAKSLLTGYMVAFLKQGTWSYDDDDWNLFEIKDIRMSSSLINENENLSAAGTASSLLFQWHVVMKSHCKYAFVLSEIDTLIGRHFPDSKTLTGWVWNLAPV